MICTGYFVTMPKMKVLKAFTNDIGCSKTVKNGYLRIWIWVC
jgi:hypothetical protein